MQLIGRFHMWVVTSLIRSSVCVVEDSEEQSPLCKLLRSAKGTLNFLCDVVLTGLFYSAPVSHIYGVLPSNSVICSFPLGRSGIFRLWIWEL